MSAEEPTAASHVLSEPHRTSRPDGRDGFWVVSCSCGYVTSPSSPASRAQKAAADHVRDKGDRR